MTTKVPQHPQEAWDLVLTDYYTDQTIPDLWFTLRHVSRGFKHIIESILSKSLLPKTYIRFTLGEHRDANEGRVNLDPEFGFSHLSDDGVTAHFKIQADTAEEYHDVIRRNIRPIVEHSSIEWPQHTLQIKRDLSDGPIPTLTFDFESLKFTCDWRKLFTIFYAEILLTDRTLQDWAKNQESKLRALRAQMEAGQLDMSAMISQAFKGIANSNDTGLKNARRARMKRQYEERHGQPWSLEEHINVRKEKAILEKLALAREAASMCMFSDDESEDDDDDDDEDEDEDSLSDDSEEDEWEDEDDNEHSDSETAQHLT